MTLVIPAAKAVDLISQKKKSAPAQGAAEIRRAAHKEEGPACTRPSPAPAPQPAPGAMSDNPVGSLQECLLSFYAKRLSLDRLRLSNIRASKSDATGLYCSRHLLHMRYPQ